MYNIRSWSQTTLEKCHVWCKNKSHLEMKINRGKEMFFIKLRWNEILRICSTLLWFIQYLTEYTETFGKHLFIDWETYLKAFKMWSICPNCRNKITQIKNSPLQFYETWMFSWLESTINSCLLVTCRNFSCFCGLYKGLNNVMGLLFERVRNKIRET